MLYRALLRLFLLLSVFAGLTFAQAKPEGPVTLAELRSVLSRAEESDELIGPTNRALIDAIEERGVDFVLTPEEEWALQLREASDELIEAIRAAVNPVEREYRLKVAKQEGLYLAFAQNFSRSDLTSKSTALNAGREFIAEYSDDPNVAQIITFMRRQLPSLERTVEALERREQMMEQNRIRSLYQNSQREAMREAQREARRNRDRTQNQTQPQPAQTNTPTPNTRPAIPTQQQKP